MTDPLDLTGHWDGIFNYPRTLPPEGFGCTLREHGGRLVGETQERGAGATLTALIDGRRDGRSVSFAKRYDDARRHVVHYHATLSADGDEIAGKWTISGAWSGGFIMTRPVGRAADAEAWIAEVVR